MAWILRLVERPKHAGPHQRPRALSGELRQLPSRTTCSGTPPDFPSLVEIGDKLFRLGDPQADSQRQRPNARLRGAVGRGDASAGPAILLTGEDYAHRGALLGSPWPFELKYTVDGYNKFLDPDGYPAIEPPWGTLNAINLDTGEIAWKIPFGEFPELVAKGMRNTGSENYGGPVVTAGGLLFIGATDHDRKFHAFDKATGKLLWETTLPAGGNATPAVYEVNGRQFVVIAAGGGKSGRPSGGSYVAFALPTTKPD